MASPAGEAWPSVRVAGALNVTLSPPAARPWCVVAPGRRPVVDGAAGRAGDTVQLGPVGSVGARRPQPRVQDPPILYFTPAWARPTGTSDKYPATDINDWGAYISAAVAHYSALGVGQFEIWNEPNLDGCFGTAVSPEQYTELLKVAYTSAKAANPNTFIVSAGLAPAGDVCNASSCRPKYFLDRMYQAGAKGYFDAFGIHPCYAPQTVDTTSVGD
jgi:hypothetical protein